MEGIKENKEKDNEIIVNRGLKTIEVKWKDGIKQKRDVMFDVPIHRYDECEIALEQLDDDNSFGETYFIAGLLNENTVRIYLEMKKRNRLELSPYEAKKVLRVYCLSLDYVKEIKSLPKIHEHGIFQHKISRIPKYKEILMMRPEELAQLKPYLPTLVNERINQLKLDKKTLDKVQNKAIEQNEENRLFFFELNAIAKEYIDIERHIDINEDNK